jgi:hypothetical protein
MLLPRTLAEQVYWLYTAYFLELRRDVIEANLFHGSTNPKKTWMKELRRQEFETSINNLEDPEVAKRWLRRIIRGHESELPADFVESLQES